MSTSLSDLTREQLYELVWAMPATKLAVKLGVSDVAIVKRCHKLAVPRPERGYWAKLEYGKIEKKSQLPPLPPSPQEKFTQQAQSPIANSTALPTTEIPLHSLAEQFLAELKKSSLSYDKQRVHFKQREFPEADVSKAQALRAAQAFHALLNLVEPRGVIFKKSRSKYDGGCFRKGNDDLHFKIEEELVEKPEKPGRRSSYTSGWQQENKVASGKLTFTVNSERYGRGTEKKWSENEKTSLETIVSDMAKAIVRHYVELQENREAEAIRQEKARVEWEIQRQKEAAAEAVRREEAAKKKHTDTLESAARTRQEDLLKAAEWWKIHRGIEDFIAECERRWSTAQADGQLTPEQRAWAAWAREVAKSVSPFETGYPDPSTDAGFDPASVSFGGPYPELRKFTQPPTMPEMPAPVVVQQSYGAPAYHPEPKPYPFWLKYQRR